MTKSTLNKRIKKRKSNIRKRLKNENPVREEPMFSANNIRYEMSDKISAIHCGSIGIIHEMVRKIGLPEAINDGLKLFKLHKPYFESDHILNMAYNIVCGGTCLEDIEVLRNNESYLDALGSIRIPDPTTAGDFCRRFDEKSILKLMEILNEKNKLVWKATNNGKKRKKAILDIDGVIVETTGEYKEGMNVSYKKTIGFSCLILTESKTGTHLFTINRGGEVLSQAEADKYIDKAIEILQECFEEICVRGDTAYSITWKFDEWNKQGIKFIFGYDNMLNIRNKAEKTDIWEEVPHGVKDNIRIHGHKNYREEVVKDKGYKRIEQVAEYVSEFEYRPTKCRKDYRVIAVGQLKEEYQGWLFERSYYQYFFYITNIDKESKDKIECLSFIRGRCNHENKIEQLLNGVCALNMPAKEMNANWAYMIMGMLAWNIKSWIGLFMVNKDVGEKIIRMEYKGFKHWFINIPCQVVKSGRYIIFRLLCYNPFVKDLMNLFYRIKVLNYS